MRRIVLGFAIIFFSLQNLSAQVKGVIIDSATNAPLDKAVVGLLIKSNITDTSYTITNEKGEFSFEKVPSSNFSVIVTNVGYRPVAKFIPVNSTEKTFNLGNIILASMAKVLGEVVIEAAPITIKEDTIEYRADAFKVKENAVVEDLLKKLPGIQVDKDGNIKAQGKDITRVKVNGKDFFGGDPKTATRELPANIVDKVQIIDDYGDQATVSGIKDGTPDKIMNIQLKKDKNTGYFGRITAGIGDQERYTGSFSGNYFKNTQQISLFANSNNTNQSLFGFNNNVNRGMGNLMKAGQSMVNNMGGSGSLTSAFSNGDQGFFQSGSTGSDGITTSNSIGINYREEWSKKLSVYGSYSYSQQNNSGYKIISQQNNYGNTTFFNNQNNQFENRSDNHRFYFNLEYNIDSFNYLKISPVVSYSTSIGISNSAFNYFADSTTKTSEGYNNIITNSTSPNVSGNILYNHKFRKRGRNFSTNISLGGSENESDQDTRNNTVQYVYPAGIYNRFLFNDQQNDNYNYSVRLTYTEPLSKAKALDIAYSHNFSYTRNNKETYNVDSLSASKTLDPFLSNDYENNYFTDRANITLRTTEKKYNYTIGISLQPVDLQGFSNTKDSAYTTIKRTNIFPVFRFVYNFSKMRSLNINYRGDARQPSFSQLQDVTDSSNLQYLTVGNPYLKPSINHSVNLSFNDFNFITGRILFTNFTFSTIQNQIINKTTLLDASGKQLTIPENVNGFYSASGFYTYSKPFKNRLLVVSLNGNVLFNHNINLDSIKNIRTVQSSSNNWIVSQGLNLELNYKDWLEFSAGANYNLNNVSYNYADSVFSHLPNTQYSSWVLSSTLNIDIPQNWILKYDFDYTINSGLTGAVNKNVISMNASLEKELFKKKNGIIKLEAFDILNQNSNITRTISGKSIIDTRSNRLNRYFMLSFTYRLQKFKGKQSQPKNIGNILQMRTN